MSPSVSLDDLMAYTEWERDTWFAWFPRQGDRAFTTSLGPNGDGRFSTVADVVRHVFSAEKRYVERLAGRALTDPASIPTGFHALFEFGRRSRSDLRRLVMGMLAEHWDVPEEHTIMSQTLRLTPRKIVVHVLLHEIRHWAQIATILRQNGFKSDFHDFLFAPVMSGGSASAGSAP